MLELQWPWLLALLPLPWLVRLIAPRARSGIGSAVRLPFYRQLVAMQPSGNRGAGGRPWRAVMLGLIWALLVLAATNPTRVGEPQALPTSGRDVLLAVDISGSMREEDMRGPNGVESRLAAVGRVVGEFLERRRGDRIGLILYGEEAYLQTPLTLDGRAVGEQLVEALAAGELGYALAGNQTAIGKAIGLAVRTLRDQPTESRVLVLLTDGANTAGVDPLQAADVAASLDLRIHTVGIGTERELRNLFGIPMLAGGSDLDERTLQVIADRTGGRFFRARDSVELANIYNLLDELEPVPEETFYRPRTALFYWPLGAALLLATLGLAGAQIGSRVREATA